MGQYEVGERFNRLNEYELAIECFNNAYEALTTEYEMPEDDNDVKWAKREIAQLEQLSSMIINQVLHYICLPILLPCSSAKPNS